MNTVKIEYAVRRDVNYDKAFKPLVFVDGKAIYTTMRCKKTMRGALTAAKKYANELAVSNYPSLYNEITITERELR